MLSQTGLCQSLRLYSCSAGSLLRGDSLWFPFCSSIHLIQKGRKFLFNLWILSLSTYVLAGFAFLFSSFLSSVRCKKLSIGFSFYDRLTLRLCSLWAFSSDLKTQNSCRNVGRYIHYGSTLLRDDGPVEPPNGRTILF